MHGLFFRSILLCPLRSTPKRNLHAAPLLTNGFHRLKNTIHVVITSPPQRSRRARAPARRVRARWLMCSLVASIHGGCIGKLSRAAKNGAASAVWFKFSAFRPTTAAGFSRSVGNFTAARADDFSTSAIARSLRSRKRRRRQRSTRRTRAPRLQAAPRRLSRRPPIGAR
jgi:hypothetical protein